MADTSNRPNRSQQFVARIRKPPDQTGQMNFDWEMFRPRTVASEEKRLMTLLKVPSLDELERVLSEPPDELALEEMGPLDELYAEDWKQDRADEAEIEQGDMKAGEKEGMEALFVTKEGEVSALWVPTPPPAAIAAFQHFSWLVILEESAEVDAHGVLWIAFLRRGTPGEFPIYEERSRYLGKERL